MKYIILFIPILFLFSCEDEEDFSQPFYVDENGVTIKAKDWVTVGTTGVLNGITYIAIDDTLISISDFKSKYPEITELKQLVTTLVTDMTNYSGGYLLFYQFDDFELYFLTSETCLGGHEDWIFMFNYESPTCNNEDGITDNTLSGSILLTHNSQSDFALLKLSENPPLDYNIYFSGWDARELNPSNCVSIHHPVGDIKKL